MNELECLSYWKNLVGDSSPKPWLHDYDMFAYFQRFRPDGAGVERVFERIPRADEIVARLLPFYRHTRGTSDDVYFVVRNPAPTTRSEVSAIVNRHFAVVRQMALTPGAEAYRIADERFAKIRIEICQGDPPPRSRNPDEDPDSALIYDLMCDWFIGLTPLSQEVDLLREAFYSMACDYMLADYIVWPLYRDATQITDPFAPSFELWIRGAGYRFLEDGVLSVFAPRLTD